MRGREIGASLSKPGVNLIGCAKFSCVCCVLVKMRMRGVYVTVQGSTDSTRIIYAYAAAAWKVIRKKGEEH